ncbi:MAG: IS701 family transposase [Chloroflexi bacterium]|nr:MAG: IS701 family transposase [Chloroflexota bacterium]
MSQWALALQQLHQRIAPRFARPEPRHHALLYLKAILSEIPRKNGWQIAEQASLARPYGMQRLLSKAVWDVDEVRDDVRAYVLEQLGTPSGSGAILVPDESGFPKRGKKSAGVKKQHCGATGRRENCQVGVFLSYVTARGHAFIDRELYLPEDWINDRERCREAGIADTVPYRPKWELALIMLKRAREAGLAFDWVTADAIYGRAIELRKWLEKCGYAYALAIACDDTVCVQTSNGSCLLAEAREIDATVVKEQDWHRLPMSQGTKGPRWFDWAILAVVHQGATDDRHWFLIRRCIDDPSQKTYYLVFAPPATPLQKIVSVVGARWHVEEDIEATKDLGIDQYEVRRYIGWYRHITLVMLAYAFLVGIRVHDKSHLPVDASKEQADAKQPLVPLTASEVRHLLARLFFPLPSQAALVQAWSKFRRQHQYWASYYHSRARLKAG